MPHIRQQIRDAIAAALGALPGVTVQTNPVRPILSEDLPVITVRTPNEQIERLDKSGRNDRRLSVVVSIYTKGRLAPDEADDWIARISAALYGDAALDALTIDLGLDALDARFNAEGSAAHWKHDLAWTARTATPATDPTTTI